MKRQKSRWRLSARTRRRLQVGGSTALILFAIINVVLGVVYRERTYPRTKVMNTTIGSVNYGDLTSKLSSLELLPESLELRHGRQTASLKLSELGVSQNIQRATDSANRQRRWLPIVNLFKAPDLQAPVAIDDAQLKNAGEKLSKVLRQDAANAKLSLTGSSVSVTAEHNGYELRTADLRQQLLKTLDTGAKTVAISTTTVKPQVTAASLAGPKADLEAQLKTAITYKYGSKTKQAAAADIASWYVPSAETYVAAPEKIQAYLGTVGSGFGIRVKDAGSVASATQQALAKKQATTLTLTPQPAAVKTFTYCVAAKGVEASYLPGLKSKLIETYGSSRGWSIDGLIEFKEVSSGCNFTVWLAAANLMPSFGDICDSMWSCRVGSNVVINFDRWQNASPAWNQVGGDLGEYRHMVINHETGHWLGFNHGSCPGPGQPALVMQQQSIDLQGCVFNAWPTASEIAALRQRLGI